MGSYMKCDICGIRFSYHDGHSCNGRNEAPRVTVEDLTRQLSEKKAEAESLRANCDAQQKTIEHLTRQLEAALKQLSEAREEIARLKIDLEVAESMSRRCPAPCGHSSQYCYTEDKGKHIVCLLCEIARLRKALEAIKHRWVPMTAREEYRRGFMDATVATRKVAVEALEASDGT